MAVVTAFINASIGDAVVRAGMFCVVISIGAVVIVVVVVVVVVVSVDCCFGYMGSKDISLSFIAMSEDENRHSSERVI